MVGKEEVVRVEATEEVAMVGARGAAAMEVAMEVAAMEAVKVVVVMVEEMVVAAMVEVRAAAVPVVVETEVARGAVRAEVKVVATGAGATAVDWAAARVAGAKAVAMVAVWAEAWCLTPLVSCGLVSSNFRFVLHRESTRWDSEQRPVARGTFHSIRPPSLRSNLPASRHTQSLCLLHECGDYTCLQRRAQSRLC